MAQPKLGVNKGNAGKGRPKGVPNKVNAQVKDMVRAALDKAGGVDYLVEQSAANPTAFLTLVGKLLPIDVNAAITDKRQTSDLTDEELERHINARGGMGVTTQAQGSRSVN